jgi:glycerol-1-phosphate dehydrogenase [NAD(P)+]
MQVYQDSRPASGAEHLISHVWEMSHVSRPDGVPWSHGFKVAVGTAASAALMTAFYELDPQVLSPGACLKRRETWEQRQGAIERYFPDPRVRRPIEAVCRDKWLEDGPLAERMERLQQVLPELRAFARERLGSPRKVIEDLKKAGCPTSPEDLGLGRQDLREAVIKAQLIRRRYLSLDAIYEAGLLPELLEGLG